jgi:hypothetical protein
MREHHDSGETIQRVVGYPPGISTSSSSAAKPPGSSNGSGTKGSNRGSSEIHPPSDSDGEERTSRVLSGRVEGVMEVSHNAES